MGFTARLLAVTCDTSGFTGCSTSLEMPSGSLPELGSQSIWNLALFSTLPAAKDASVTVAVKLRVFDSPAANEMPVHSKRFFDVLYLKLPEPLALPSL